MSWLGDLKTRVEQAGSDFGNTIGNYLDVVATDPTVLISPNAPNGNLSQAQIDQGQTGSTAPLAAPSGAPRAVNAAQNITNGAAVQKANYMPWILGGAGLVVLMVVLKKRGRRRA